MSSLRCCEQTIFAVTEMIDAAFVAKRAPCFAYIAAV